MSGPDESHGQTAFSPYPMTKRKKVVRPLENIFISGSCASQGDIRGPTSKANSRIVTWICKGK